MKEKGARVPSLIEGSGVTVDINFESRKENGAAHTRVECIICTMW